MSDFIKVAALAEVPPGNMKCVTVGRRRIALYNVDGTIYATDDTCSHAEASLSDGQLCGNRVVCPLHGAEFDVRTGAALRMPAVAPVDTYTVRVDGPDILIKP